MRVVVAEGKNWLGHKAGAKLNLKEDYAAVLIGRGVVEREKKLIRSDVDKQVKSDQESTKGLRK